MRRLPQTPIRRALRWATGALPRPAPAAPYPASPASSPAILVARPPALLTQIVRRLSRLEGTEEPSANYLASASVSYPLVGLTQLSHYVATLDKMGKTHEDMVPLFKGATGHSQVRPQIEQ